MIGIRTSRPLLRALVSLSLMLANVGCGGGSASSSLSGAAGGAPGTLAGTAWTVRTLDGRASVAGKEPTVAFDATTVSGSAGCNTYSGDYIYDAASATLTPGSLAWTRMFCEGPLGTFEGEFLLAFQGPLTVSVTGDDMTLEGDDPTRVGDGHMIDLTAAP
jgi:heat shock protein HslJ